MIIRSMFPVQDNYLIMVPETITVDEVDWLLGKYLPAIGAHTYEYPGESQTRILLPMSATHGNPSGFAQFVEELTNREER